LQVHQLILFVFVFVYQSNEIFAMDKEEFWETIDFANERLELQPLEADYLVDVFSEFSKSSLISSYEIFESIVEELDCNNVYALGSGIKGEPLTDDGFRYFRSWLVTLGKDVVTGAIDDPVTLLQDEEIKYCLLNSEIEFEDFHYFIDDAFSKKFNASVYEAARELEESTEKHHDPMTMNDIESQYADLMKMIRGTQ
jgi:hypothetical protein